jgi:transposase-like protein
VSEVKIDFKTQIMESQDKPIDNELIKKQALEQFRSGKGLTSKGGFCSFVEAVSGAALQAELDEHLAVEEEASACNRKNGNVSKTLPWGCW